MISRSSLYQILYPASTLSTWRSAIPWRLWQLKIIPFNFAWAFNPERIRSKVTFRRFRSNHHGALHSSSWWTADHRFWVSAQDSGAFRLATWNRRFTRNVTSLLMRVYCKWYLQWSSNFLIARSTLVWDLLNVRPSLADMLRPSMQTLKHIVGSWRRCPSFVRYSFRARGNVS